MIGQILGAVGGLATTYLDGNGILQLYKLHRIAGKMSG